MKKYRNVTFVLTGISWIALIVGCTSSSKDPSSPNSETVTLTTQPMDGSVNVSVNSVFTVSFTQPMNPDSVGSKFMLHQGWGSGTQPLAGSVHWNAQYTQFTFQPATPLSANTTYTMHMMGMMLGTNGTRYHPMLDTLGMMGGMGMGGSMMMGGMSNDEMRVVCSTGPTIVRQLALNLTQDVVLVADGGSGDITAIDPANNTVIGVQPLDSVGYLHHLSISPDRTTLIVSDPGEDMSGAHGTSMGNMNMGEVARILLLDSRTLLATNRIVLPGVIHNAIVNPEGTSLWFANAAHNTLHRYSFPGLTAISSVAVGNSPLEVTITPNGQYALVANEDAATISRVRLITGTVDGIVNVGVGPVGAWITPDGQKAWVTNESGRSVTVVNIDPFRADTTLTLGYSPGQAFVNPVRPEVYVADEDNGSIHVYNSNSLQQVSVVSTGRKAHGIAFKPDGSRVYVSNEMGGSVSVIDCATRTVIATIPVGMRPNGILYRAAL